MGHLTEDLTPDGPRLGGAAAFAGLVAHRFGVPAAILTAVDAAFPYLEALAGIPVRRIRSRNRTRFRNRYRSDGSREQTILSRAATIPESEIQRAVTGLPPGSAVLYVPVADELGGRGALPRPPGQGALAGAAPQGLIRRWNAAGRVSIHWSARALERLAGLDFLSLSETEFPEDTGLPVPLVAVTRGRHGAVLRRPGLPAVEIPASPGAQVDPEDRVDRRGGRICRRPLHPAVERSAGRRRRPAGGRRGGDQRRIARDRGNPDARRSERPAELARK